MNPIVWEIHKFSLGKDESSSYKGSDYLSYLLGLKVWHLVGYQYHHKQR